MELVGKCWEVWDYWDNWDYGTKETNTSYRISPEIFSFPRILGKTLAPTTTPFSDILIS